MAKPHKDLPTLLQERCLHSLDILFFFSAGEIALSFENFKKIYFLLFIVIVQQSK